MGSRNRGKPSLREQVAYRPLDAAEFQEMTREMFESTDRSAALLGVAMIDAALEGALKVVFAKFESEQEMRDMFRSEVAPLADLSAKLKIASAVGLISRDAYRALNILRNIRNAFAHSFMPLKFDQSPVKEECDRLPEPKKLFNAELEKSAPSPQRRRFVAACAMAANSLEEFSSTHGNEVLTLRIPDDRLPTLPRTP